MKESRDVYTINGQKCKTKYFFLLLILSSERKNLLHNVNYLNYHLHHVKDTFIHIFVSQMWEFVIFSFPRIALENYGN